MRALLASALLAVAPAALGCGYCVEDKVASVYDHAAITRALAQKHHVVFFHVEGALPAALPAQRALRQAIASSSGVHAASVRLAPETATLAVAFDPARTSLAAVQSGLEKRLARHQLSLMAFQVMDRPADLKRVK
jgi:hypothetical protein